MFSLRETLMKLFAKQKATSRKPSPAGKADKMKLFAKGKKRHYIKNIF
jgi:hypothetical protein